MSKRTTVERDENVIHFDILANDKSQWGYFEIGKRGDLELVMGSSSPDRPANNTKQAILTREQVNDLVQFFTDVAEAINQNPQNNEQ